MAKKIENIEVFNAANVKDWKRKDFVKAHESRFPNAEEIYDALGSSKKKKKEEK